MRRITSVVWRASLAGLAIAVIAACLLWRYVGWQPEVTAEAARALLTTIIQAQAGILAIAVSFSVLYVELSLNAYSLRAAHLLIRHRTFHRLISVYTMSLAVIGMLALFVIDTPSWLPLAVGLTAIILFIGGLATLVGYIADVAQYVTPEAVIDDLLRQRDNDRFRRDALDLTGEGHHEWGMPIYPKPLDAPEEPRTYRVPTSPAAQARITGEVRILIDLARRMVRVGDRAALKAALDALVGFGHGRSTWSPKRSNNEPEETITRLAQLERVSAAKMAYLAGALLEIWDVALQHRDRQAAVLVVGTFRQMLGHYIVEGPVTKTDILREAVYERLFVDTSQPTWRHLRPQVVDLIAEGVRYIDREKGDREYPGANDAFSLLYDMGQAMLVEENLDGAGEGAVMRGITLLGRYGAATGNRLIVANLVLYLEELAKHQRGRYSIIARLVRDMGTKWASVSDDLETFDDLLRNGILGMARAYNLAHPPEKNRIPHNVNIHLLDALQDIAVECIKARQWWQYEQTLDAMGDLVVEPNHLPGDTALRIQQVGVHILKQDMVVAEALRPWIDAVGKLLDGKYPLKADWKSKRLLATARSVSKQLPDSDDSQALNDLIKRLEALDAQEVSQQ